MSVPVAEQFPDLRHADAWPDDALCFDPGQNRFLSQGEAQFLGRGVDKLRRHSLIFRPLVEVVPGVVYEGYNIMSAPPKLGKTRLAHQLMTSVDMGVDWLGREVRQAPVLSIAMEDTLASVVTREQQFYPSSEALTEFVTGGKGLRVVTDPGRTPGERLANLETALRVARDAGHPYGLVVIDTAAKFLGNGDVRRNAYEQGLDLYGPLDRLGLRYHAAIVGIHHDRKGSPDVPDDPLSAVSGGASITGVAQSIMSVKRIRGGQTGLLTVVPRSAEERTFTLEFRNGWWSATEERVEVAGVEEGCSREVVRRLVAGPATLAELCTDIGVRYGYDTVRTVCQRLKGRGLVDVGKDDGGRFVWALVERGRPEDRSQPGCDRCGERPARIDNRSGARLCRGHGRWLWREGVVRDHSVVQGGKVSLDFPHRVGPGGTADLVVSGQGVDSGLDAELPHAVGVGLDVDSHDHSAGEVDGVTVANGLRAQGGQGVQEFVAGVGEGGDAALDASFVAGEAGELGPPHDQDRRAGEGGGDEPAVESVVPAVRDDRGDGQAQAGSGGRADHEVVPVVGEESFHVGNGSAFERPDWAPTDLSKRHPIDMFMELLETTFTYKRVQLVRHPYPLPADVPVPFRKQGQGRSMLIHEGAHNFVCRGVPYGLTTVEWAGLAETTEAMVIDRNGGYLGVLGSAELPIGRVREYEGMSPDNEYGAHLLASWPSWELPNFPHPGGNYRRTKGEVWVPTSTLKVMREADRLFPGALGTIDVVKSLAGRKVKLDKIQALLRDARMRAIEQGDTEFEEYQKKMYSKGVSTMGESPFNRNLWRPDWCVNIRGTYHANHWRAFKRAWQHGRVPVGLRNTDELWTLRDPFAFCEHDPKSERCFGRGRALDQWKPKALVPWSAAA